MCIPSIRMRRRELCISLRISRAGDEGGGPLAWLLPRDLAVPRHRALQRASALGFWTRAAKKTRCQGLPVISRMRAGRAATALRNELAQPADRASRFAARKRMLLPAFKAHDGDARARDALTDEILTADN
jgi:hypothetical protein